MASWFLAASVFLLVKRYTSVAWFFPALAAAAVVLFPPLWEEALALLPDALCTALIIGMLAVVCSFRAELALVGCWRVTRLRVAGSLHGHVGCTFGIVVATSEASPSARLLTWP